MSYRPLEYYLQQEAELVKTVREPIFFSWRVEPAVIFGRHQIKEQEINVAYCEANGVRIVQRQSGGGCVYADEGNVMMSYISPSQHSKEVFKTFIARIADALKQIGYEAVTTEHNDILVDGHKVSGGASYTTPTGTVVHCTMMYDVNIQAMLEALTPSAEKLAKHSVASVRQRVVNLKEIKDIGTTEQFEQRLCQILR